jgi:WD40 repeat protein
VETVHLTPYKLPDSNASFTDLSPDGRMILASNQQGNATYLLDFQSGELAASLVLPGEKFSTRFSSDGGYLLAARSYTDAQIVVYDAQTLQQVLSVPFDSDDDPFTGAAMVALLSPDRHILAASGMEYVANQRQAITHLYTLQGQPLVNLKNRDEGTFLAAFSPDSTRLALATSHGDSCSRLGPALLEVWDIASQAVLYRRTVPGLESMVFAPNGEQIALASAVGYCLIGRPMLALWTPATDELRHLSDLNAYQVVFSPDGTRLVTLGDQGVIRLWDTTSGQALHEWHLDSGINADSSDNNIQLYFRDSGIVVLVTTYHYVQTPDTSEYAYLPENHFTTILTLP